MFCGDCGEPLSSSDRFCNDCGALVGDVVDGRFMVQGVVGRGESGVSFLTFDSVLERLVLMRELSAGVVRDPVRWSRLRTAVSAMAGVDDVHCVQIFSLSDESDPPLLFTEWVSGPSLAAVMVDGPLGPAAASVALDGALAGLGRLHEAGLAHGYLMPSRVILDQSGRSKVADVGLGYGANVPAEAYMFLAPEVFEIEDAEPTEEADIFAAGALLAGLSTGRAPFPSDDVESALSARGRGAVGLDELPDAVAELIRETTAVEPSDRLSSLTEFRDRLNDAARAAAGRSWAKKGTAALAGVALATESAAVLAGLGTTAVASVGVATTGAGAATTGVIAAVAAKPVLAAGAAVAGAATLVGGQQVVSHQVTQRPAPISAPSASPTTSSDGDSGAAGRLGKPPARQSDVPAAQGAWKRATNAFRNSTLTLPIPGPCVANSLPDGDASGLTDQVVTLTDGASEPSSPDGAPAVGGVTLIGALTGHYAGDSTERSVVAFTCEAGSPGSSRRLLEVASFKGSQRDQPEAMATAPVAADVEEFCSAGGSSTPGSGAVESASPQANSSPSVGAPASDAGGQSQGVQLTSDPSLRAIEGVPTVTGASWACEQSEGTGDDGSVASPSDESSAAASSESPGSGNSPDPVHVTADIRVVLAAGSSAVERTVVEWQEDPGTDAVAWSKTDDYDNKSFTLDLPPECSGDPASPDGEPSDGAPAGDASNPSTNTITVATEDGSAKVASHEDSKTTSTLTVIGAYEGKFSRQSNETYALVAYECTLTDQSGNEIRTAGLAILDSNGQQVLMKPAVTAAAIASRAPDILAAGRSSAPSEILRVEPDWEVGADVLQSTADGPPILVGPWKVTYRVEGHEVTAVLNCQVAVEDRADAQSQVDGLDLGQVVTGEMAS